MAAGMAALPHHQQLSQPATSPHASLGQLSHLGLGLGQLQRGSNTSVGTASSGGRGSLTQLPGGGSLGLVDMALQQLRHAERVLQQVHDPGTSWADIEGPWQPVQAVKIAKLPGEGAERLALALAVGAVGARDACVMQGTARARVGCGGGDWCGTGSQGLGGGFTTPPLGGRLIPGPP